jgi:hypothetical protein
MATVTIQQSKYSPRLTSLIEKLDEVEKEHVFSARKRGEAIKRLYQYAVIESKQLSKSAVIKLIMEHCEISRATVYNHISTDDKRKYTRKDESLKVRQFEKEQVRYEKVNIVFTLKGKETSFQFENIPVENELGRFKIFHYNRDVHLPK